MPEYARRPAGKSTVEAGGDRKPEASPSSRPLPTAVAFAFGSHGRALEPQTRAQFEQRFGVGLEQVRVHTGGAAGKVAKSVNASAFAFGSDIVFGQGEYAPGTARGDLLLAHELAHVVQQRGQPASPQSLSAAQPDDPAETEARAAGLRVVSGRQAGALSAFPQRIHRAPTEGASGRVLVLGLYERPFPGGQALPVHDLLIREAQSATGMRPVLMGGMESFGTTWKELQPSGLASGVLVQEALERTGVYDIHAIFFNTKGVKLLEKFGPRASATERVAFPEGTSQTGAELRSVVASMAAGQHKVDLYFEHEGGSSTVRAGSQTVEGAPLPAEWRPHLPPSFKTASGGPEGGGPTGKGGGEQGDVEPAPVTKREGLGRTPSGMKPPKAPSEVSVDPAVRSRAKLVAEGLGEDLRLLKFAEGLSTVVRVVEFVSTLLVVDQFISMAQNQQAGKGFIMTDAISDAENLRDYANTVKDDYPKFSDSVWALGVTFYVAGASPESINALLLDSSDLGSEISSAEIDVRKQSTRIKQALGEVTLKRKAAETLVTDPVAAAGLDPMGGTVGLATAFAAWQDLSRIEGALMQADEAFDDVHKRLNDDIEFVVAWHDWLQDVGIKAGTIKPTPTIVVTGPST